MITDILDVAAETADEEICDDVSMVRHVLVELRKRAQ